jgi:hypothetical protein
LGGLEPPTSGATNLRSNQLSYNRTRQATPMLFGSSLGGSHTVTHTDLQALSSDYPAKRPDGKPPGLCFESD